MFCKIILNMILGFLINQLNINYINTKNYLLNLIIKIIKKSK